VKLDGKQLALFAVGDRVFACNNRCPHEVIRWWKVISQVPQTTMHAHLQLAQLEV